jgi:CheY-like chemotaxis protein
VFFGDMPRLRQILINLVGNAVKFTDEGEVCLEVKAARTEGDLYKIEFLVSDTGVGISPEALALLFRPFQQVDASATRRHGGTGLGLAISQRLAELMGGEIKVSSILSIGSTFRFTITLRKCSDEELIPEPQRLPSCHLLLIACGGKYPSLLKHQLETWGAKVMAVSDPMTIMEMTKNSFAAVLMDRTSSTVALAAQMQYDPAWKAVPRILFDFDEPLSTENLTLFHKRLSKPFKPNHLYAFLLEITGGRQKTAPPLTASLGQPLLAEKLPLRILLAEDNHINQKVGVALLSRLGYRADVVANGLQALDSVARQTYDLVLLDIQIPAMEGLEAAQAMRKKLKGQCPKLVALTANAFHGAREEYMARGFDDYLSKPLLADALRQMITRIGKSPATSSKG